VGPVGTVAEALAAVKNERFDAALLDLNLHDELAYDVADALLDADRPFIIMSGYGHESIEPPFNMYPHIEKPFTQSELRRVMQDTFGRVHHA
jgi:CheY-like chemotaxis protein